MGLTLEVEESDFSGYIDDGEFFSATIVNIKLEEKKYTDKETGEKVKKVVFVAELEDPAETHTGRKIYGETGVKLNTHPNNKLRNWAGAILGAELPAGYRLDTDDLIGKQCRVVVGYRTWDKDNGEKGETNFISDIMPSSETAARMAEAEGEPF